MVLLYGLYNVTLHPLRSYPGPILWRAYRIPATVSWLRGNYVFDVTALHARYGPVIRVGPNQLSYTTSAAIKTIYGHHNAGTEGFSEFDKDPTEYSPSQNGVHSMLSAPAVDHGRARRLLSHAFSASGMRDMQPRVQAFVELLITGLKDEAAKNEEGKEAKHYTDMVQWYNWTTFDLIGSLGFGSSFGCLENRREHPWIKTIFMGVKVASMMTRLRLYSLLFLAPLFIPKELAKTRVSNMHFSEKKIEERIKQGTDKGDFWDTVIKNSDFEKGTGMTKKEMVANASLLVLGGSETTATLLAGTSFLLCKNPAVMKKLSDEVRRAFEKEEDIDLMSVGKLEYMLAVLDEAMRIYPPVPKQGNRVVPKQGAFVAGKWVPGGTSLEVDQYAANHSNNFHNPESFVPERWLNPPPPEFAQDDLAARAPFSSGPRNCIGRNLAYAEMRLILAKVCWNFDMELDEERCGNWTREQKVFQLWEKKPLWIRLRSARR